MTNPTTDDVAETLAEYERLAIRTGARVAFDAPEFAGERGEWNQLWLPETPPAAARATVYRDGAATTVVRLWRDHLPADDAWRALWEKSPMVLFGAFVRRDAIRHGFRDVIGDRREPDEVAPAPAPAEPRDYAALIPTVATPAELDALFGEASHAGAITLVLDRQFRTRRRELIDAAESGEPVQHRLPKLRGQAVLERPDAPRAFVAPTPRPPAPGVHTLAEVVKPRNSRKGESRAQRDSGKRRGGGAR